MAEDTLLKATIDNFKPIVEYFNEKSTYDIFCKYEEVLGQAFEENSSDEKKEFSELMEVYRKSSPKAVIKISFEDKIKKIPSKDVDFDQIVYDVSIMKESAPIILQNLHILDTKHEAIMTRIAKSAANIRLLSVKSETSDSKAFSYEYLKTNLTMMSSNFTRLKNDLPDIKITATFTYKTLLDAENVTESKSISNLEMENENQTIYDYIDLARYCDIESEEFTQILTTILDPVANVFKNGTFIEPSNASHYSAIIGPSFMGKTQFSFILARKNPVFYFNFCADVSFSPQKVYKVFEPYTRHVREILNQDMETIMKSSTVGTQSVFDSGNIFMHRELKLFSIGFIWSLIEYSMEFDFSMNDGNWFNHYLEIRSTTYSSLSLEDFYKNMSELFADPDKLSRFKCPIVFIDELEPDSMKHIKLLRNVVRCLILPCVLSSTNSNVNNMLKLNSVSTPADFAVWVNAIRRLLVTNLEGIVNRIRVKTGVPLNHLVNNDFSLKESEDSDIELLKHFNISCDEENKKKFINMWKFLIIQSKTCLQGSSYYAIFFVVKSLQACSGNALDPSAVWSSICDSMNEKFIKRKANAFIGNGKFFSLRMFSTNERFDEKQVKCSVHEADAEKEVELDSVTLVKNSIKHHFYHFGDENEPSVLPFDITINHINVGQEIDLVYNGKLYPIKSHFLPFENDTLTSMALWYKVVQSVANDRNTIASITRNYVNCLVGVFANPSAKSNDSRAQEVMTYWALANASHQSFNGKTGGIEFFRNFFKNIQIPNDINIDDFDDMEIPVKLDNFLRSLTIPYLVPEKLSTDFKSLLEGLCDFGLAYRCSNNVGLDVGFDVLRNGVICRAFAECKYRDAAQGKKIVKDYIDTAKSENSILTFFVSYQIHEDLKEIVNIKDDNDDAASKRSKTEKSDIPNMRVLRSQTMNLGAVCTSDEPNKKKAKKDFKLNIYSFYFQDENSIEYVDKKAAESYLKSTISVNKISSHNFKKATKKVCIKKIQEVENPDGVFIVVESTFNVWKI